MTGPRFARGEIPEDPLLALGIDESDPARLLVGLQLRHEPEPLVQRLDERAVVVRDLLPVLADDGVCVLVHGPERLPGTTTLAAPWPRTDRPSF